MRNSRTIQRGLRVTAAAMREDGRRLWRTAQSILHPGRLETLNVMLGTDGLAVLEVRLEERATLQADTLVLFVSEANGMEGLETAIWRGLKSLPRLKLLKLVCPAEMGTTLAEDATRFAKEVGERVTVRVTLSLEGQAREGLLEQATTGLAAVRANSFEPEVQCMLQADGTYYADDMLGWIEEQAIKDWGFDYIPTFTANQRFHASLFFGKLARRRDVTLARREHYRRVSVHLSMDKDGEDKNTRLIHPIPEVNASLSMSELGRLGMSAGQSMILHRRLEAIKRQPLVTQIKPAMQNSPANWGQVLITGWYGTETIGDKAILGEIAHFIRQYAPTCRITVTTIERAISEQTRLEMPELHNSEIVDISHAAHPALIEQMDAVFMGGGPLMETSQMEYVWQIFREANRQQKARIIFGCGVGPIHTERIEAITGNILSMATAGFLRDPESYTYAKRLAPGNLLKTACDPAMAFATRWAQANETTKLAIEERGRLITLLRANTREFVQDQDIKTANERAAFQLGQFLSQTAQAHRLLVDLAYTNAPWIGGDDRLFNRQVSRHIHEGIETELRREYLTTEGILTTLRNARAAVAMRYHGHIFCMALGIPFLSINYTGNKGKVYSLVRRSGYEDWSLDWRTIEPGDAANKMSRLLAEQDHWSAHLRRESSKLVKELEATYEAVFNIGK